MKLHLIVLALCTVRVFGAAGGSTVLGLTEARYIDGVNAIHREYTEGEFGEIVTDLGHTEIRYDMTDITMRGNWAPLNGGSWEVTTDEWVITLTLTDPSDWLTVDFGGRTHDAYGFHLSLERSDGEWSHTLEHLGAWIGDEFPFTSDGSITSDGFNPVGTFLEMELPIGFRYAYYQANTTIPYDWANGGITDTLEDRGSTFRGGAGAGFIFYDTPVNDETWLFSLNVGFEDGDLFARFGMGKEIRRETFLIPEPGTWMLLTSGLAVGWMGLRRKRRGGHRSK